MTTKTLTYTYDEIPAIAAKRGVKGWEFRIRSMARQASIVRGTPYGDNVSLPFIAVRVTGEGHWPLKGAITLTREDGRKFRLALSAPIQQWSGFVNRFTVEEV